MRLSVRPYTAMVKARAIYIMRHLYPGTDLGFYKGAGRVSNPSERGTGGRAPKGSGIWGGAVPAPRKVFVFLISKWLVSMHSRGYLLTL